MILHIAVPFEEPKLQLRMGFHKVHLSQVICFVFIHEIRAKFVVMSRI